MSWPRRTRTRTLATKQGDHRTKDSIVLGPLDHKTATKRIEQRTHKGPSNNEGFEPKQYFHLILKLCQKKKLQKISPKIIQNFWIKTFKGGRYRFLVKKIEFLLKFWHFFVDFFLLCADTLKS